MRPDLFLVNLAKDSFTKDGEIQEIPEWLDCEEVTINWLEKDIGPYGKLIPALSFAGDTDLIITVDDDILYSKTLIEDLVGANKKHPEAIISTRGNLIKKNIFNTYQNTINWIKLKERISFLLGLGELPIKKDCLILNF